MFNLYISNALYAYCVMTSCLSPFLLTASHRLRLGCGFRPVYGSGLDRTAPLDALPPRAMGIDCESSARRPPTPGIPAGMRLLRTMSWYELRLSRADGGSE